MQEYSVVLLDKTALFFWKNKLAEESSQNIGDDEMMNSDDPCHQHMLVSNECTTGGFISGEAKLAIVALRIPGEGSLLDTVILFDTTFPTAYKLSKIGCCMSHSALLMVSNTALTMHD